MIANPLAASDNTVSELFKGWPDGTALNRFDTTLYQLTENTIKAGEWAAVWDRRGAVRIVPGPTRLLSYGGTIERLPRHTAGPQQYLAVRFRDGRVSSIRYERQPQ